MLSLLEALSGIDNPEVQSRVAESIMDLGEYRAVTLLQYAVNDSGGWVAVDGRLGPSTLSAVNAITPRAILSRI